jgi:hypothetical protein
MCDSLRKALTPEIVKNKGDFSWTIFNSLSCLLTNAVTSYHTLDKEPQGTTQKYGAENVI